MKRIISLILVLIAILTLMCSCSKPNDTPPPPVTDEKTEEDKKNEEKEEEKVYVDYSAKQRVEFYDVRDKIVVNGRCTYDKEHGVLTAWPNSGVEFSGWFDGSIRLYFTTPMQPVNFYVVVDGDYEGAKNLSLSPSLSYATLANVKKGYHTIGIYKVDGAQSSNQYLTAIEFKGKLDEEPIPKKLKIEIIGDSISCGTGLVSPNYENDAYYSYGAILSRGLNAQLSIVAVPGWGISCGVKSFENVIPRIYKETCSFTRTGEQWDFAANQVDAVILNLGTNDYLEYVNSDRTKLLDDLDAFFDTIREAYPDARIYMTYGMMNRVFMDDFMDLIEARGDDKLKFVDNELNSSGKGGHPDAAAHLRYAKVFDEIIREDFGIVGGQGEIQKLITEKNKLVTTVTPKE